MVGVSHQRREGAGGEREAKYKAERARGLNKDCTAKVAIDPIVKKTKVSSVNTK